MKIRSIIFFMTLIASSFGYAKQNDVVNGNHESISGKEFWKRLVDVMELRNGYIEESDVGKLGLSIYSVVRKKSQESTRGDNIYYRGSWDGSISYLQYSGRYVFKNVIINDSGHLSILDIMWNYLVNSPDQCISAKMARLSLMNIGWVDNNEVMNKSVYMEFGEKNFFSMKNESSGSVINVGFKKYANGRRDVPIGEACVFSISIRGRKI